MAAGYDAPALRSAADSQNCPAAGTDIPGQTDQDGEPETPARTSKQELPAGTAIPDCRQGPPAMTTRGLPDRTVRRIEGGRDCRPGPSQRIASRTAGRTVLRDCRPRPSGSASGRDCPRDCPGRLPPGTTASDCRQGLPVYVPPTELAAGADSQNREHGMPPGLPGRTTVRDRHEGRERMTVNRDCGPDRRPAQTARTGRPDRPPRPTGRTDGKDCQPGLTTGSDSQF